MSQNGWSWHHLRQQGFLTVSIVICSGLLISALMPGVSWRTALIFIAVLALVLGWIP